MESTIAWLSILGIVLGIVVLVSFFNLCINVSKIRKHFIPDENTTSEESKE